ncbi:hypothetical protein CSC67_16240 [Pusillimonas caeni]|nr:BrnA antitoxin family protein [Pusillimonas caeni]TFL11523.1 hypothetical protein CSC67_16240 [Pusillimonas caeni]
MRWALALRRGVVSVSLRIPPDVLTQWKATGAGWQTRMVESLKRHAPKTT